MDDSEIEHKVWVIVRTWLEGATPEQWHRFAARSNYDGNGRALRWLLDNCNIDRATALLIYWNLGAAWFVQYANESDLGDASYQLDTFRLAREVERRYADGYYADHGIWFDPHDFEGAGERLSGRAGRAAGAGADAAADERPRVCRSRRGRVRRRLAVRRRRSDFRAYD